MRLVCAEPRTSFAHLRSVSAENPPPVRHSYALYLSETNVWTFVPSRPNPTIG